MTHPEAPWQFELLSKDRGVHDDPIPGNLLFPKIVGIILTLISIQNIQPIKANPLHFALHMPSVMAHTLSVECTSLWIWINPFLTDHFVSHWILFVMGHQEPELHSVLKPGIVCFGWVRIPAHRFKSQSVVNGFNLRQANLFFHYLTIFKVTAVG